MVMIRRGNELRDKNDVLRVVNDPRNNIKFIRLVFPDVLGRMMDFTIPVSELGNALNHGKTFDGSATDGNLFGEEIDLKIIPDPKSLKVLPWTYGGKNDGVVWKEAILFGEIYNAEGEHFSGDSRFILKKLLQKAKEAFNIDIFNIGVEIEFFLLNEDKDMTALDDGDYFFSGNNGIVRKEIQLLLNEMGIETVYDHHEASPSQHEINLKYRDALEMADTCMLFKYVAKRVARQHNLYATFMPKPINNIPGSGLHLHQSLWSKGKNLFYDDKDRYKLSSIAKKYLSGLIQYGSQISLVANQYVNSYKRLQEGDRAPTHRFWGRRNKSSYVRVPEYMKGRENSTRIESRSPDPACNFYLTFAMLLSAGLQGVKENLELDDPIEQNLSSLEPELIDKIPKLPSNLSEALEIGKKSKLLKLSLGEHMYNKLLLNKTKELDEYENAVRAITEGHEKKVTGYEIKKFLNWL